MLEEIGHRKLVALGPQVRPLCGHYRTSVRTAARNTAKALGIADIPEYRPEDAFTPWLDRQLKEIAQMVEGGVPKDAKWSKFTVTYPKQGRNGTDYVQPSHGWLLSDGKEKVEVLDMFGQRLQLSASQTKIEPSTLEEQAKALLAVRKKSDEGAVEPPPPALRRGMLTGQFEPGFISLPEALVAAWLQRGTGRGRGGEGSGKKKRKKKQKRPRRFRVQKQTRGGAARPQRNRKVKRQRNRPPYRAESKTKDRPAKGPKQGKKIGPK